jgi:hypothetical protein
LDNEDLPFVQLSSIGLHKAGGCSDEPKPIGG